MRISRLFLILRTALLRTAFLLAVMGVSSAANAQSLDTYGFSLGYEFGAPLDISRDPGTTNPLAIPLTGLSQSHSISVGANYILQRVLSDLNLRFGAGYSFSIGRFTSDSYFDTAGVFFNPFSIEDPPTAVKQFYVNSTSHLFSPSFSIDWQPGSNWQFGFGLWGAINLGSSLERREELTGDPINSGRYFRETSGGQRTLQSDTVAFRSFRWGPSISMSWKLDGGRNLDMRPEIFGKMDVTSAGELGARAFSAGVRLNFILNAESKNRDISGTPSSSLSERQKELPEFTAAVRITSNGVSLDAPIVAQPRSVLYRKFETMLPFLEIPAINDRERVSKMIDALGKRIAETPGSITLVPSAQESILETAGAELRDSIKLAASRYQASATTVSVQPAQRNRTTEHLPSGLLVTSDLQTLLRPIADQWIESRFQLPPITIERFTDSRAGIKAWSVVVRQGRRTLARYSNLEGGNAELESGLFLNQDDNATIAPILAEMTVTDLADQIVTVYDTLQLTKGVTDPTRADSTVYEYVFYSSGNNTGAFEVLGVSRKLLLKTLRDQLASSKSIEIQYNAGSMSLASDLLGEISKAVAETSGNPEIKMRLVKDLTSPRTIQAVRVLQSN